MIEFYRKHQLCRKSARHQSFVGRKRAVDPEALLKGSRRTVSLLQQKAGALEARVEAMHLARQVEKDGLHFVWINELMCISRLPACFCKWFRQVMKPVNAAI